MSKRNWMQEIKENRKYVCKFEDPLFELESYVQGIIEGTLDENRDDISDFLTELLKDKEDRDAILGFVTQITNSVELRCKIMNEFMDEWSKE